MGPKIRDLGLSRISLQVSRIGSGTHREANRTFRFDVGAKILLEWLPWATLAGACAGGATSLFAARPPGDHTRLKTSGGSMWRCTPRLS